MKYLVCMLLCGIAVTTVVGQPLGCTDPLALNYNSDATTNDGSCLYAPASLVLSNSQELPATLSECSGLMWLNSYLWTHNDNNNISLYALDTTDMHIADTLLFSLPFGDWEAVETDGTYTYIGDFGNNYSGNRQNLRIFRISNQQLHLEFPQVDTIAFFYPEQSDFSVQQNNTTDFDCEAFVVGADSIYLFTKEWATLQTTVYTLPKEPGNYAATSHYQLQVDGLITDAAQIPNSQVVVLCGYTQLLQPFLVLLYDFPGRRFDLGNKRKIGIDMPLHQFEGITYTGGFNFYLTNESFHTGPFDIPQQVHSVNLEPYLETFLTQVNSSGALSDGIQVSPNPVAGFLKITTQKATQLLLYSPTGALMLHKNIPAGTTEISLGEFAAGVYHLHFSTSPRNYNIVVQ